MARADFEERKVSVASAFSLRFIMDNLKINHADVCLCSHSKGECPMCPGRLSFVHMNG